MFEPEDSLLDSLNLSKATKLKGMSIQLRTSSLSLPIVALNAVGSEHRDFRAVLIYILFDLIPYDLIPFHPSPINIRRLIGEIFSRQWMDLDHLLAQLHESHAVHAMVVAKDESARAYIEELLPEATKGGCIVHVHDLRHTHYPYL